MTSMIERCTKEMVASEPWSSFWSEQDAQKLVRAVIVAMREPTARMNFAGECIGDYPWDGKKPSRIFTAMIDEALKETP